MPSRQEELRERTKRFALQVMLLLRSLPPNDPPASIRNQLLRSATSMAANYRAAGRARSRREFISKLALVIEESDETVFWLELLSESVTSNPDQITALLRESQELVAIFAASHRTVAERAERARPIRISVAPRKRTPDG
jgi:four helix bundle protein